MTASLRHLTSSVVRTSRNRQYTPRVPCLSPGKLSQPLDVCIGFSLIGIGIALLGVVVTGSTYEGAHLWVERMASPQNPME